MCDTNPAALLRAQNTCVYVSSHLIHSQHLLGPKTTHRSCSIPRHLHCHHCQHSSRYLQTTPHPTQSPKPFPTVWQASMNPHARDLAQASIFSSNYTMRFCPFFHRVVRAFDLFSRNRSGGRPITCIHIQRLRKHRYFSPQLKNFFIKIQRFPNQPNQISLRSLKHSFLFRNFKSLLRKLSLQVFLSLALIRQFLCKSPVGGEDGLRRDRHGGGRNQPGTKCFGRGAAQLAGGPGGRT